MAPKLWLALEAETEPREAGAAVDAVQLVRSARTAGAAGVILEIGPSTSENWLGRHRQACAQAGVSVMARVASTPILVERACELRPEAITLRWARPDEEPPDAVTALAERMAWASRAIERARSQALAPALLIPPERVEVDTARMLGVDTVVLDAACYSGASSTGDAARRALQRLREAAVRAHELGLAIGMTGGLTADGAAAVAAAGVVQEIHLGRAFLERTPYAELGVALQILRRALP